MGRTFYNDPAHDPNSEHFDEYHELDIDTELNADFAEPGGNSALRAATRDNPRNQPCPTCHWPNRLTPRDVELGYQCNSCADVMEGHGEIDYYEGPEELTPELIEQHCKLTFDVLYGCVGGVVTVDGAGTEVIRVVVAFPNNQSLAFVCETSSDGDVTKLIFEREGFYAAVQVDLEGSLI